MEDNKTKKHDAIHKNLFQTLFPYAIQAMYPSLHENLDYTNMHFLKEEFQLPTSSSYFHIDRRYIDILAEVPLKNPIKNQMKIRLGEDQKLAINEAELFEKFKDILKPKYQNAKAPHIKRSKKKANNLPTAQPTTSHTNQSTQQEIILTEDFQEGDIRSQRILIHIELERTSDLVEMSKRMREYFSIISQQSAWSTVIPFVVFFHNGHESGLRWVDLMNAPFDELIVQYRFISWGSSSRLKIQKLCLSV